MKVLKAVIIIFLLIIDWLIFHDLFKGGERYTVTEFLTGLVSIPVIIIFGFELFRRGKKKVQNA